MSAERTFAVPPDAAWLSGRTGRGVRVVVVDSGVNPWHPHVRAVAGGVDVRADGTLGEDWIDRLGHGTAVCAAIKQHAPDAELWVARVFEDRLATRIDVLVRALEWAMAQEPHLVNLSLGTATAAHRSAFEPVLTRASAQGTLVVSADVHDGREWLPGTLPQAVGVRVAPALPQGSVCLHTLADGGVRAEAVGLPRPIPGVPAALNLHGISFAVATTTGALARVLEGTGRPSGFAGLRQAFRPASLEAPARTEGLAARSGRESPSGAPHPCDGSP
ncbi:MAG: S8 family serine peptidase [Gemmatimonadota bacterium]|nr:S8 family serine peptidase [Gemmatimonadota bacterium]